MSNDAAIIRTQAAAACQFIGGSSESALNDTPKAELLSHAEALVAFIDRFIDATEPGGLLRGMTKAQLINFMRQNVDEVSALVKEQRKEAYYAEQRAKFPATLAARIGNLRKELEKYTEELLAYPHIFGDRFPADTCAKIHVLEEAYAVVSRGATVEELATELERTILREAVSPASSTNQQFNIMERERLAARADLLRDLRHYYIMEA